MRPGFTCTAEITTATRSQGAGRADPGDDGPRDGARRQGQHRARAGDAGRARPPSATTVQASELKPGQERKELEGVFVVRDGKAVFEPVKTGIAGEKYFEIRQRPEGRRQRDRRPVRVGADAGRRRGGQGRTGAARDWRHQRNDLFPRVGDDRAAGDLGEQAPLVPDRARQHRGRDLDHRRGVAHPGHERLRHRHHRVGCRRRQLHDSAHAGGADGSRRGAGAEQPAHHGQRGGRRPALQRQRRRRRGAVAVEREPQLRQRDGRRRPGPRRHPRLHLLLHVRRRARPADQPG